MPGRFFSPYFRRYPLVALLCACLQAIACDGSDPLERIREQQKTGQHAETLEPLRALLKANPEDGELNFLYGRALAYTTPNLAVWSLRKAMEDPDWSIAAGTQLAYLALAGGDYNEVNKITEAILARDPDNQSVRMMRANAYAHSRKDPEAAIEEAQIMLEIDPHAIEAYEPLILGLLGLDRFEEAKAELAIAGELLVELDSQTGIRAWHCATSATFEQESGDIESARETWEHCLEEHPGDPDVVSSAILFYDFQGQPERGLEILRNAIASDPSSPFFPTMLARRLFVLGQADEAEAVLTRDADSADAARFAYSWIEIAKLRQSAEDYSGAADAYERALTRVREADTPTAQLLFEYADALLLAERLDKAEQIAEEIEVPALSRLLRARVAQERGEPALALEEFDEALQLWPDNSGARYYAALAAEELGDFDRALVEYRNAVRTGPADTDARTRGAELLVAEGFPLQARTILLTASDEAPLDLEAMLVLMHVTGLLGDPAILADSFVSFQMRFPSRSGDALAQAAEGLAHRGGPAFAVEMLANAPGVDYSHPLFVPALRALVRFSHEAGPTDTARDAFKAIFEANPDSAQFQEVRALDLELAEAPDEAVRSAYARVLELEPENARALAGVARLSLGEDPANAIALYDRAAASDPGDPGAKLEAARALITNGQNEQAMARLDALLLEHPLEGEAAALRARMDLEANTASPETLERARRATRFQRSPEAYELLSEVHVQLGDLELAEKTAQQARKLRERRATRTP